MKYVKTPDGKTFLCEDCVFFDETNCSETQRDLAQELFEQCGIIIAEKTVEYL